MTARTIPETRARADERAAADPSPKSMKRRTILGSRWAIALLALVLAGVAIVAIRPIREPVLRGLGWALVASDPIGPADVIVVTLDSGGAGALKAADLVHDGVSKRVAVFEDPPSGEDFEFIRRGLPYYNASTAQIQQLAELGLTHVERIARIDGTNSEARALPQWADAQRVGSMIVVAASDHSRRLRRVLGRAMKGHPTRVAVEAERYSDFDPDRWWRTRGGVRTEIVELEKLVLDYLMHPMSF